MSSNYPPGVTGNEPEITGEPTPDERVEKELTKRFGQNWHRNINIEMSAFELYWILRLAMWGAEQKEAEYKAKPASMWDMSERLNVASHFGSIDTFAQAVAFGPEVKSKKKRK